MRNVIVTGGSRGLGLSIAATLAASGYRVIAIARSETPALQEAAARLSGEKRGELRFRQFDLTDTSEISTLVAGLRKEHGPLYGLINNAGIGTAGVLSMMRDEHIESLARLNIVSPIIMTKYVLRSMMVERAGRIVNISSIIGTTGYSGLSAYAATKASLLGFTRSLAREVGQLGITVNAVAPGFVETDMTGELTQGERDQIIRRSALKRLAGVEDVAAAVEFLLSEKAKNMTGVTLTVDAGNTA
ncbi:MAG TPA: SDR family NAD(P)-dependent oxidoreductase [Steroidobacteraceae bacterium]|nr:SDR family NAD(P)-dependent oxidoreductase [Steroidobacteraceae bacterium]